MTSGYLLIDKPAGMTSHDVVDAVRKFTKIRKVGHAGTLDPFATGLLIVAVGREATRDISKFVGLDKTYEATYILGAASDTDDRDGKIVANEQKTWPTEDEVWEAMKKYMGEIEQIPPQYAAIKIKGKKMYELARAGEEVKAEPRKVKIWNYNLIKYDPPKLKVEVRCSSGTYIRALARDLGQDLGCGAYVDELRRTAISDYKVGNAIELDYFDETNWGNKLIKM